VGHAQVVAAKAKATWEKLRKERDFHRMHHKRIAQEKNKLVEDMKRLKTHFESYEPTVRELRAKYEAAIREKMLAKVERDKLAARVTGLETQLRALEGTSMTDTAVSPQAVTAVPPSRTGTQNTLRRGGTASLSTKGGPRRSSSSPTRGATGGARRGTAGQTGALGRIGEGTAGSARPAPLPEELENPFLKLAFEPAHAADYKEQSQIRAHGGPISSVAFHPTKPVLSTVSDDMTWRLWAMPDAELIMTGEGHRAWLADVDFHPEGTHLATSSGDGIIKLWDLTTASCSATLADHTQTTWSVAFHQSGDFLLSGSMDHTCRMFDVRTAKVRQTLRGHVDSVNAVCWQPFAVNVATGSGDKTVSVWDVRTGLCVQTFYGHTNAVNDVTFNLRGDTVASCDADGVVRLWDIRMVAERASVSLGRMPIHCVAFDRSAAILTAACDDGSVRVIDTAAASTSGGTAPATVGGKPGSSTLKVINVLRGHKDAVQTVAFDPTSTYLVSAGNDATVRVWAATDLISAT
jgi:WD40 repeat protein